MKLENKITALSITKLINAICEVSTQMDKYIPMQELAEKAKIVYFDGKVTLSKIDIEILRFVLAYNEKVFGETVDSKNIRKFLKEP